MRLWVAFGQRAALWFRGSNNRLILGAAVVVAVLSVAVKGVAMVKESVVAYRFGTSDDLDAFLIAFLLPSFLINIIAGGLASAFTPVYVEIRERDGADAAKRLLQRVLGATIVVAIIVTAVAGPGFSVGLDVFERSFTSEKLALTRSLLLLLLPTVPLSMLVTLWSAALNAEHRFAWAAWVPVAVPLCTLVAVLLLGNAWSVHAIAFGTLGGYVVQCGALGVALWRRDMALLPRWGGLTPDLKRVARQYGPIASGALLATGGSTIAQALAGLLPSGSVATLNYGGKVVAAITEIGSMAIATALLPHFSLMVARREWSSIRRTLAVYIRLMAAVTVPLTLILIVLSGSLVRLLFERGAFTDADTQAVASVQSLFLLQIPFVMVGMLFVRLASALQRNDILLWGGVITLPLQVILAFVGMRWMGAAGIALATSATFLASCCYLILSVRFALRMREAQWSTDARTVR